MALTSTLYTGLSGLDVNQTKLNVVGNNIANANTVAFKSSRALFKPQFYVTDSGGAPPSSEFGGSNPSQRGLGAVVSSIEKDFSPGSIEPTGKATDLAIDGGGFFIVASQTQSYTRDGSFALNSDNVLVTQDGEFVQGFGVDANANIIAGQLQKLTIPIGALTSAKATTQVDFTGNLNADGPVAAGASILNSQSMTDFGSGSAVTPTGASLLVDLRDPAATATPLVAAGDVITINGKRGGRDIGELSYTITAASSVADFSDFMRQALGIDTSVVPTPPAPAPSVTMGAIAGDPANTARFIVTGNLGAENELSMTGAAIKSSAGTSPFSFADGKDASGLSSDPSGESVYTGFVAYDSLGTPLNINVTAVLESKATAGNTWRFFVTSADDTDAATYLFGSPGSVIGTGTLTFDNDGKLLDTTGATISIDRVDSGATTPLSIQLDFESMTSLTSQSSSLVPTKQDGNPIGTLNEYSIGDNGVITGQFSNGLTRTLGQIAIATFNNPLGLVDSGANMYKTGANSGVALVSAPLQLSAGGIKSGALELSNVDLSKEFINLIIASTGFSASSRVITTSDQLLTELLNASR